MKLVQMGVKKEIMFTGGRPTTVHMALWNLVAAVCDTTPEDLIKNRQGLFWSVPKT